MHRSTATASFTCANCEVAIVGPVTFHVGLPFCCAGCVAAGPCVCSYDLEVDADPSVHLCHDIADGPFDAAPAGAGRELALARR